VLFCDSATIREPAGFEVLIVVAMKNVVFGRVMRVMPCIFEENTMFQRTIPLSLACSLILLFFFLVLLFDFEDGGNMLSKMLGSL
jgi:hypothetical protein